MVKVGPRPSNRRAEGKQVWRKHEWVDGVSFMGCVVGRKQIYELTLYFVNFWSCHCWAVSGSIFEDLLEH